MTDGLTQTTQTRRGAPAEALQAPVTVLAPHQAMKQALKRYSDQPLLTRMHTRGRHWLCPMEAVAKHVPLVGRVLDVGCGHGLFANMLAIGSPQRQVVGVDPSESKIASAEQSSLSLTNIRYIRGMIEAIDDGPYDCITILDVLYLLPDEFKREVLRACRHLLSDSGQLLLKTNDTRPRWKYALVRTEEFVMVKALGLTLGGELHFRSEAQYTELLRTEGFEVARIEKLDGLRPAPHRLYICKSF